MVCPRRSVVGIDKERAIDAVEQIPAAAVERCHTRWARITSK